MGDEEKKCTIKANDAGLTSKEISSTFNIFFAWPIPIEETLWVNVPLQYRFIKEVLPTPVSPTNAILGEYALEAIGFQVVMNLAWLWLACESIERDLCTTKSSTEKFCRKWRQEHTDLCTLM